MKDWEEDEEIYKKEIEGIVMEMTIIKVIQYH